MVFKPFINQEKQEMIAVKILKFGNNFFPGDCRSHLPTYRCVQWNGEHRREGVHGKRVRRSSGRGASEGRTTCATLRTCGTCSQEQDCRVPASRRRNFCHGKLSYHLSYLQSECFMKEIHDSSFKFDFVLDWFWVKDSLIWEQLMLRIVSLDTWIHLTSCQSDSFTLNWENSTLNLIFQTWKFKLQIVQFLTSDILILNTQKFHFTLNRTVSL